MRSQLDDLVPLSISEEMNKDNNFEIFIAGLNSRADNATVSNDLEEFTSRIYLQTVINNS